MTAFSWIFGIVLTLICIEGQVPTPIEHHIPYTTMAPSQVIGVTNPN